MMEPILENQESNLSISELSEEDIEAKNDDLLKLCSSLQQKLDEKSQQICDHKKELSRHFMMEEEYLHQIEVLQTEKSKESEHLKYKIQKLEEEIKDLNDEHSQQTEDLDQNTFKRDEEICSLQDKIHSISNNASSSSVNNNEIDEFHLKNTAIKNKIEDLENEISILVEGITFAEKEHAVNQEQNNYLQEELSQLNEIYKYEKEELNEVTQLNEDIQEDLILIAQELEIIQRKPLQDRTHTNSLFAEVDDKRLEIQQTMALMKSQYLEMKSQQAKLLAKIASLNSTTMILSESWEADTQDIIKYNDMVKEAYSERVKFLQNQLRTCERIISNCQKPSSLNSRNAEGVQCLENLLETINKEIKLAKEQADLLFLSKTILSHQLRNSKLEKSNWETKMAKCELVIEKLQAQSKIKTVKLTNSTSVDTNSTVQKIKDSSNQTETCSKQKNLEFKSAGTSVDECNKENTNAKEQTQSLKDVPKKVGFADDVEHSGNNRNQLRKGCKIIHCKPIILKKKS